MMFICLTYDFLKYMYEHVFGLHMIGNICMIVEIELHMLGRYVIVALAYMGNRMLMHSL